MSFTFRRWPREAGCARIRIAESEQCRAEVTDYGVGNNARSLRDVAVDGKSKKRIHGGDIREIDILNTAMKGMDYVICLSAMWLLHCKDYPRTAFDVNIAGTFNVLEACVNHNIKKLIWSSSASVYGDAVELPMTENHPFNNKNFYGATKIAG